MNIKLLGRIVNVVILVALSGLLVRTVSHKKPARVIFFYVLPIVFILLGNLLNFIRGIDIESLGTAYIFLPWLAALSVPFIASADTENSWKIFYRFVLITTGISLIEYGCIFAGLLAPTTIETDRGIFVKGILSILTKLDEDLPHYRFFGIFAEPGTAAMFLLPALAYALLFAKRMAALVLALALYLTDSLGGLFGLFILVTLFIFWKLSDLRYSPVVKMLPALVIIMAALPAADYFHARYEDKQMQGSALPREENVAEFLEKFGDSFVENPLGFELKGKSLTELESQGNYFGSSLMFYVAFVQGGVLAFLGYLWFFLSACIFSVKYYMSAHNPDKIVACAFISLPALLTFVFQRTTIFESVLFAFLFGAPFIEMIRGKIIGQEGIVPRKAI